jgi:hypothetical protein
MKHTIKLLAIIALVAIIGLTIAACSGGGGGKLSGTYSTSDGSMSYTFSGKKVTAEALGEKRGGTYELKDGKIIISSPDGKTETYGYKLEGNTLTLDWYGIEIPLTKK